MKSQQKLFKIFLSIGLFSIILLGADLFAQTVSNPFESATDSVMNNIFNSTILNALCVLALIISFIGCMFTSLQWMWFVRVMIAVIGIFSAQLIVTTIAGWGGGDNQIFKGHSSTTGS